jgi:hypothetical protein
MIGSASTGRPGTKLMADDLRRGAYLIAMDKNRLDVHAIHAFLARSYWSPGVPIEVVARAIEHSLCFGLFCDERRSASRA